VVFTEEKTHNQFTHLVTVSAPHEYPIKQVEGCIAREGAGAVHHRLGRDVVHPA